MSHTGLHRMWNPWPDRFHGNGSAHASADSLVVRALDRWAGRVRILKCAPLPDAMRELGALLACAGGPVARVHDVAADGHGRVFWSMSVVPGRPLAGPCSGAADWARAALGALVAIGEIHARGVLHGDLKPEHVRFTEGARPRARLLDFGSSFGGAWAGEGERSHTPGFTAPEVLRGWLIDERADLYSVARILERCAPASGLPRVRSDWLAALGAESVRERPRSAREALEAFDASARAGRRATVAAVPAGPDDAPRVDVPAGAMRLLVRAPGIARTGVLLPAVLESVADGRAVRATDTTPMRAAGVRAAIDATVEDGRTWLCCTDPSADLRWTEPERRAALLDGMRRRGFRAARVDGLPEFRLRSPRARRVRGADARGLERVRRALGWVAALGEPIEPAIARPCVESRVGPGAWGELREGGLLAPDARGGLRVVRWPDAPTASLPPRAAVESELEILGPRSRTLALRLRFLAGLARRGRAGELARFRWRWGGEAHSAERWDEVIALAWAPSRVPRRLTSRALALAVRRWAPTRDDEPRARRMLIDAIKSHEPALAEAEWARLGSDPRPEHALHAELLLAEAALRGRRLEEARARLRRAADLAANDRRERGRVTLREAWLERSLGRPRRAEALVLESLRLLPASAPRERALALQHLAAGRAANRPRLALRNLRAAAALARGRAQRMQIQYNLSLLHGDLGELRRSLRAAEAGLAPGVERVSTSLWLGLEERRAWALVYLGRAPELDDAWWSKLGAVDWQRFPSRHVSLLLLRGWQAEQAGDRTASLRDRWRAYEVALEQGDPGLRRAACHAVIDAAIELDEPRLLGAWSDPHAGPALEGEDPRVRAAAWAARGRADLAVATLRQATRDRRHATMTEDPLRRAMQCGAHVLGVPDAALRQQVLAELRRARRRTPWGAVPPATLARAWFLEARIVRALGRREPARRALARSESLARRARSRILLAQILRTDATWQLGSVDSAG